MKSIIRGAAFTLLFLPATQAAAAPITATTPLLAIWSVLGSVTSLEFESIHQASETDIYRAIMNEPASQGRTAQIKFAGRGAKYDYTETLTEWDGTPAKSNERAYDGLHYQGLNPFSSSLTLYTHEPVEHYLHLGFFNPLNMFAFLNAGFPGHDPTVSWQTVMDLSLWKKCFSTARLLGEFDFNGKSCVAVKFDGGLHKIFNVPCTYTVYFSKSDGYFPWAWKAVSTTGRILEDYQVDQFGTAPVGQSTFYYPEKAETTWYTEDTKYPAGQPQGTITTEVTSFQLNSLVDDRSFSINPQKANSIYDADRKVVTAVPHER